jgi:hypothetical protein
MFSLEVLLTAGYQNHLKLKRRTISPLVQVKVAMAKNRAADLQLFL